MLTLNLFRQYWITTANESEIVGWNLPSIIFLSSSILCDLSSSVNILSLNCFCTWTSGIFYVFCVFYDVHDFLIVKVLWKTQQKCNEMRKLFFNVPGQEIDQLIEWKIVAQNILIELIFFSFNKLSFVVHDLFSKQNRN